MLTVARLAVTGAGVSLLPRSDAPDERSLAWASDPVAARLEDLQLTVGEGPGLAATASGVPVLVPELSVALARWPAFAPAALAAGAAAVFSFPLVLGALRLGSLDCYRTTPGELGPGRVGAASVLAAAAFAAVLAAVGGHDPDDLGWISDLHAEVHQACGIVMHDLKITVAVAFMRIRAHAYSHDLPISVVARRIVNHELTLEKEQ